MTNEHLTAKTSESETLTADLEATTERLTAKTAESETLTADLEATTERLTAKTAENATLTADLATTTERLETITTQLADKTSEHQALTARHDALVEEVGTLEGVKGQIVNLNSRVESLNSQIGRLNGEITELERRREPLIVDSHTAGFKCTGSMEPRITYLDSATWLENFNPEDIVVGAVISFTPTAACELDSGPVAHRVMSISPNPPKDTDGRREDRRRGMRELQGRWPGLDRGRWEVGGGSSVTAQAPNGRLRELGCAGWQ